MVNMKSHENHVRRAVKGGDIIVLMRACTVKKVSHFPVPSRDVTTWPGIIKFFPARESLRIGTGKSLTFFYVCGSDRSLFSILNSDFSSIY